MSGIYGPYMLFIMLWLLINFTFARPLLVLMIYYKFEHVNNLRTFVVLTSSLNITCLAISSYLIPKIMTRTANKYMYVGNILCNIIMIMYNIMVAICTAIICFTSSSVKNYCEVSVACIHLLYIVPFGPHDLICNMDKTKICNLWGKTIGFESGLVLCVSILCMFCCIWQIIVDSVYYNKGHKTNDVHETTTNIESEIDLRNAQDSIFEIRPPAYEAAYKCET